MRVTNILLTIAVILIGFYVLFLVVSAYQISNEKAKCKTTPVAELQDANDYQYCLLILRGAE